MNDVCQCTVVISYGIRWSLHMSAITFNYRPIRFYASSAPNAAFASYRYRGWWGREELFFLWPTIKAAMSGGPDHIYGFCGGRAASNWFIRWKPPALLGDSSRKVEKQQRRGWVIVMVMDSAKRDGRHFADYFIMGPWTSGPTSPICGVMMAHNRPRWQFVPGAAASRPLI